MEGVGAISLFYCLCIILVLSISPAISCTGLNHVCHKVSMAGNFHMFCGLFGQPEKLMSIREVLMCR